MKTVSRRCTKIKAGEFIELAGGIVVRNPSQFGINVVVETPIQLSAQPEAPSHEQSKAKVS